MTYLTTLIIPLTTHLKKMIYGKWQKKKKKALTGTLTNRLCRCVLVFYSVPQ